MNKRVLVVDDSLLCRKKISAVINEIPGFEVVETAHHGKEALAILQKGTNIDVVTLDIEMPIMDGITTLREIVKFNRSISVIMVSSLSQTGAKTTLDALMIGARDFVTKQSTSSSAAGTTDTFASGIQRALKSLPQISSLPMPTGLASRPSTPPALANNPKHTQGAKHPPATAIELLLVGSSTGGPNALCELFTSMKTQRNYITVIVQHMPPIFTDQLAKNLSRQTNHSLREASDKEFLKKGDIVIAPGGRHLELVRDPNGWQCKLNNKDPVNFCRPSVDVTFDSVAAQLKHREAVAIILTGMGADGAAGCQKLHAKGVPILTQERHSCIVYGMPKAVDELGMSCVSTQPTFLIAEAEKFMIQPQKI